MRVALPVHRGLVSPVFDWARCLLVVDHDGDTETARREERLEGLAPAFRAGRLAQIGVETLLCGGISAVVAEMVESQGTKVVSGLAGEVDAVLEAFFSGRLPDPTFAMPGWRGCGREMGGRNRCRKRQRRRGGRGGRGRGTQV